MAITLSTIADPLGSKLIIDTDADSTAEANVTGATGSFYAVEIDNTANTSATYVKLADASSGTAGTTQNDWQFYAPASTKLTYIVGTGMAFSTALTVWAVTSPAALTNSNAASATSPTSNVSVKILST